MKSYQGALTQREVPCVLRMHNCRAALTAIHIHRRQEHRGVQLSLSSTYVGLLTPKIIDIYDQKYKVVFIFHELQLFFDKYTLKSYFMLFFKTFHLC